MNYRAPTGRSFGHARYMGVIAIAVLAWSCGSSARATPPTSGGTRAGAASCVGLTARQEYRSARIVLEGRMLPGATASVGDHRVLSSPARVDVTRYLKGHGPRIVRVQTGVTATSNGVSEDSEGILPLAGERWRILRVGHGSRCRLLTATAADDPASAQTHAGGRILERAARITRRQHVALCGVAITGAASPEPLTRTARLALLRRA